MDSRDLDISTKHLDNGNNNNNSYNEIKYNFY